MPLVFVKVTSYYFALNTGFLTLGHSAFLWMLSEKLLYIQSGLLSPLCLYLEKASPSPQIIYFTIFEFIEVRIK